MIEQTIIRTAQGLEIPAYCLNTVIVGAGAAGVNCAVHLYEFFAQKGIPDPQDRIAIVTSDRFGGASRLSGSDKQTYYKLGTSASVADSAVSFAESLTANGCCHGDIALVEGLSSLREFYHLVQLGVPFPHDAEGAYIGYKTDHDPYERATSAGPKTSAYMCECLDRQAARYRIETFDGHEIARLLATGQGDNRRIVGVLTVQRDQLGNGSFGLTVFLAENVVLAAGGPGELYGTSVYPHGQCGIHGLALEAGLKAHNLTESQFGLASTRFRWNVSGTYMQVVPRILSTAADGSDERDFLGPHFASTSKMCTNIFLKGYQWPFDPQRVSDQQSSLIDVLVHGETSRGRRVFLDFRSNPVPQRGREPFDLMALEPEALDYLQANGALQRTPIERLEHMNPLAIDIYSEHGIDIRREPLEIAVCAQHNNGGFAVDKWWQSSIPHTFVIGEMAGTHGVKRPGGSALNSGQAGGLRAAEYIANAYGGGVADGNLSDQALAGIDDIHRWISGALSASMGEPPSVVLRQIQENMSKRAAHLRNEESSRIALEYARNLYSAVRSGGVVASKSEIPEAVQIRHLALAHVAFIQAIVEYLESEGGSRGSFLVMRQTQAESQESLPSPQAIIPENVDLRDSIAELEIESLEEARFKFRRVPVRSIPTREQAFEVGWREFRTGEVYRKD